MRAHDGRTRRLCRGRVPKASATNRGRCLGQTSLSEKETARSIRMTIIATPPAECDCRADNGLNRIGGAAIRRLLREIRGAVARIHARRDSFPVPIPPPPPTPPRTLLPWPVDTNANANTNAPFHLLLVRPHPPHDATTTPPSTMTCSSSRLPVSPHSTRLYVEMRASFVSTTKKRARRW